MEPVEAVLQFLRSVGSSSDAEFYLGLFRARPRASFAVLAVDRAAIQDNEDGVALDLRLLNALDLTPVVVLGLDDSARASEHAERLRARLASSGLQSERHSLLGAVDAIRQSATLGRIPVVEADIEDRSDALSQLATLINELHTHKLIYLRQPGGLRPRGERVSVVNLSTEFATLVADPSLGAPDRALLREVRELLFDHVEHRLLVSVTSPINLLHELFTLKGAGTLLRRGARIVRAESYAELDHRRLDALLQSSFGAAPAPEFYDRPIKAALVEEAYRGAALVSDCPLGGYLTKFAVEREAQGEGLGQDLWSLLTAECDRLLWRARRDNPIRAWYERNCDARVERDDWTVYMRGLETSEIPGAVEYAIAQPRDFAAPGANQPS